MTPTELSRAVSISVPYASQLMSGERRPSLEMALRIYDKTGERLGALENLDTDEIETARKMTGRAA